MSYWLLKSEPDVWSIDQQKKAGRQGAPWDGVRNYQASKNLKNMKKGDQCFFYHSNIGKEIVGIVEVIKEAYLDKTDKTGRFVAVTVKFIRKLKTEYLFSSCTKGFFLDSEAINTHFQIEFEQQFLMNFSQNLFINMSLTEKDIRGCFLII